MACLEQAGMLGFPGDTSLGTCTALSTKLRVLQPSNEVGGRNPHLSAGGTGHPDRHGREHAHCLARMLLAYVLHKAHFMFNDQVSYLGSLGLARHFFLLEM